MIWGAQLEKGSSPSPYIYTYNNSTPIQRPNQFFDDFNYVKWGYNEPSNSGNNEHYGAMYSSTNPYLNDTNANTSYRHIVEFSSVVSPTPSPYDVYLGEFNGHTYFYENGTQNWQNSKTQAENAGGYLFVPNTKEEYDFIGAQINTSLANQWFHIGIYQDLNRSDYSEPDGGWIGVDGKLVNTPILEPFTILENGQDIDIKITHTISQSDFDSGGLSNTAIVNDASAQVSDTSDDGDDTDGNTEDDPTIVITDRVQVIEVTKNASITDNGDGVNGVEDIITYTIKVKNAGNVSLSGLVLEDILSDAASNTMSLNVSPTYSSTYKLIPGKNLNTDEFWGSSSEPNQSSTNYKSASIQFNNPPTISDDRYYWNNHYAIIKSSVATTTFNGSYNATLIGTYNGNYYYMSDNSTSWDNQKSRFQTPHSNMLIIDSMDELEWIKSKKQHLLKK